jgi:uncharacterized protein YkwD
MAGVVLGLCLSVPARHARIATAQEPAPNPVAVALERTAKALERPELSAEDRVRLELYQLITQYRAEHGLPPLALDDRLNASATEHSVDMAVNRYCRHNGTDGSSSRTRMNRHGYPYNNWAGENIVCGKKSPEAALTWWRNSTPHRRNLLHGHFTHIGIGYAPNGPWGPQWTLNFAAGAADTVVPGPLAAVDAPPEAQPAAQ